MPSSRPGGLQLLPTPPRSRSRGGLNAGSPDQPGRRNPHTTSPSALPPEFIRAAKRLLQRQRDAVRNEVPRRSQTPVHNALADIDEALRRIEQGGYGRCHACGAWLSHPRLVAILTARLCSGCQRTLGERTHDPRPVHASGCTMARTHR
jgi:RNA polymerase-binding transcription factor DksA